MGALFCGKDWVICSKIVQIGAGASGGHLSCSGKKDTKEAGLGEALRVVLPPPQAPSPGHPSRALGRQHAKCFGAVIWVTIKCKAKTRPMSITIGRVSLLESSCVAAFSAEFFGGFPMGEAFVNGFGSGRIQDFVHALDKEISEGKVTVVV